MGCPAKIPYVVNGTQVCSLSDNRDHVCVRGPSVVNTFFMVFTTGDFAIFCDDTQFVYKNKQVPFWGLQRVSMYPLARKRLPVAKLFKRSSIGSHASYLSQYVKNHDTFSYDSSLQALFWKAWFRHTDFAIADQFIAARIRALAEIHGFNFKRTGPCQYKVFFRRKSSVHRLHSLIKIDPATPYRITSRITFRSQTQGFIIKN